VFYLVRFVSGLKEVEMGSRPLRQFRLIGYAEGVSFLVLLGIAMPLKHLAGYPKPVLVVGWIHGVLWILYLLAAARAGYAHGWSKRHYFLAFVASVLPFGPFVFDRWLRWESNRQPAEGEM
jgi:integral membrane protein